MRKDAYYEALTPANIRASLVRYLLREGAALEEIIYLMNIEIRNLGNYISLKDIDNINELKRRKRAMIMIVIQRGSLKYSRQLKYI